MIEQAKQDELSQKARAILAEALRGERPNPQDVDAAGAFAVFPVMKPILAELLPAAVDTLDRAFNGKSTYGREVEAAYFVVSNAGSTPPELREKMTAMMEQAEGQLLIALDRMQSPYSGMLWLASKAVINWHSKQKR